MVSNIAWQLNLCGQQRPRGSILSSVTIVLGTPATMASARQTWQLIAGNVLFVKSFPETVPQKCPWSFQERSDRIARIERR
jgi:hypothetical protein